MKTTIPPRPRRSLTSRPIRILLGIAFYAAALIPNSDASLLTNWTPASDDNFVGGDTANPAFVGTAAGTLWARFDTVTLEVGDKVTLEGKVTFSGLPTPAPGEMGINSNNFTWGIYNNLGNSDRFGWWGYAPGNARADGRGQLFRSIEGNNQAFNVGAHATSVKTGVTAGGPLISDTYSFTLTFERSEQGMQVSWTLDGLNPGNPYSMTSEYFDPSDHVVTWSFNQVGISARSGAFGGSNSSGAQYEAISLTYTAAIPEGQTSQLLLGSGALFLLFGRTFLATHR